MPKLNFNVVFHFFYKYLLLPKQSSVIFYNNLHFLWITEKNILRIFYEYFYLWFLRLIVLAFTNITHNTLFLLAILYFSRIDIYVYILTLWNPASLGRKMRTQSERSRAEIRSMQRHAPAIMYPRCKATRPCFKFQTAVRVHFLNLHEVAGGAGKLKETPQAGGNKVGRNVIVLIISEYSY